MPCPDCGVSLHRAEREVHECDRDDVGRFLAFQLRHEVDAFDSQLAVYLASPQGRFAVWEAERRRL
jgi:hypothetical protein